MTERVRRQLHVEGVVHGVGFRAFLHDLATRMGLDGLAGNDADGVFVEVEGDASTVDEFVRRLRQEPPPLAVVEHVSSTDLPPTGERGFDIVVRPPGTRGQR